MMEHADEKMEHADSASRSDKKHQQNGETIKDLYLSPGKTSRKHVARNICRGHMFPQ